MKKLFILTAIFLFMLTEGHAIHLSAYFSSTMGPIPPEFKVVFILPDGTRVRHKVVENTRIEISDDIPLRGNEIKIPYYIEMPLDRVKYGACQAPFETKQDIETIRLNFKWEGWPDMFSNCDVWIK